MADLYGTCPSSTMSLSPDSQDFSPFLNQHLHNSSSTYSSSSCMSSKRKYTHLSHPQPLGLGDLAPGLNCMGASPEYSLPSGCLANQTPSDCRVFAVDSSTELNVSDPGSFFSADVKPSTDNAFCSAGGVDSDTSLKSRKVSSENYHGGYSCDSEIPEIPDRPQSSSKRSRAAEVHNLSEKRRRSRINEKLKALQNLIPNSSKTDKASMLDEAIEYLKQLQLQVQMLSMRNGMSLHPACLAGGVLQPVQLYQVGMDPHLRNSFSGNEECQMQSTFSNSNNCSLCDKPIDVPSGTNITNSGSSFGFGSVAQAYYGNFKL